MRLQTIVSLSIGMAALSAAVSTQAQTSNPIHQAAARSAGIPAKKLPNPRGEGFTPMESCTYTFTTGSGRVYLNYCITANGTFWNFQSPSGVEMLDQNGSYEGYGFCDNTTDVGYYDYLYAGAADGTASGPWDSPTTLSSSASSVKIERVTGDGLWTLTQTITMEAGPPPYAKVVMTLKNNSTTKKFPNLMRYANFLNDNAANSGQYVENYDADINSAWGYNSFLDRNTDGGDQYGLMLQNVTNPSVVSDWFGYPQNVEQGPDPCNPYIYDYSYDGTLIDTEGSGVLLYAPAGGLIGGGSMTVTLRYIGF